MLDFIENHVGLWTLLGVIAASIFALLQYGINQKLAKVQTDVGLFAYRAFTQNKDGSLNQKIIMLRMTNVGNLSLYLQNYSLNNADPISLEDALIPIGQQQSAWFDINLGELASEDTVLSLKVKDALDRCWGMKVLMLWRGEGWHISTHAMIPIN